MIVMVSMKTCSARDPDQRASTKPSEITSKRPPCSTSSIVGVMMRLTAFSVRARSDRSMIALRTSATCEGLNWSVTKPIAPARAKISGGTERTAKKAASAASPVTRCFRHDPTVVTTRRHTTSRTCRSQVANGEAAASCDSTLSAPGMALT